MVPGEDAGAHHASGLAHLRAAGAWIVRTPLALFVIVAGLALDSVARLFLTFSSSYFRLIGLPAASYGLIGAALGGLGLAVSPLARRMVARGGAAGNFAGPPVHSTPTLTRDHPGGERQTPSSGHLDAVPQTSPGKPLPLGETLNPETCDLRTKCNTPIGWCPNLGTDVVMR